MKCSEIRDHLFDHAMGELTPEIEIQVNGHLTVCGECREELQKIEAIATTMGNAARFSPAPRSYARIAEQLRTPRRQAARLFGFDRNLVFALGAFLFGIVLTRSVDTVAAHTRQPVRMEVRQDEPGRTPFADTVEFYAVPARNLARI